jgi:hypothetical protein
MIILDLNQVMISNLMAQIGNHTNIDIDENHFRHMVVNTIRALNLKFRGEYGELVIACDDKNCWRRDAFPYYKANRKKDRDKSEINWDEVFKLLNKMREELKIFFPYKVVQVDRAEADDIIGVLIHERFSKLGMQKVLILSGDKDFRQLHVYPNVEQYDPVKKKFIRESYPEKFLKEHIIRGDKGDGVPNCLSARNSFVVGKRQKSIHEVKLEKWVKFDKPEDFLEDSESITRWYENQRMVDLSFIPEWLKHEILNTYDGLEKKNRTKLFDYFMTYNLRNLMDTISEF